MSEDVLVREAAIVVRDLSSGTGVYRDSIREANECDAAKRASYFSSDADDLYSALDAYYLAGNEVSEAVFTAGRIGREEDSISALVERPDLWALEASGDLGTCEYRLWLLRDQPTCGFLVLWDSYFTHSLAMKVFG